MDRYEFSLLIGQGSFGSVYKALRREDEKLVAIKVISKRGRSNREIKNLRRECDIQARLKHPHVIEMLESFESKFDLFVVTEFALIDLHRYLSFNGAMQEEYARRVICHLVSALYYLHSNRILHRDLKPQNVLLDKNMHAKLCDFGLARNMTMGTHVLTSIKGTPLYMAPELLAEQPYDHLADIWSLGCIAYESVAAQPPFCATSILHLVKLIKHEEVKWPSTLSIECRSFLQGLLEKDPSLRISWAQMLCHPFVEGKLYIAEAMQAAQSSPFTNPQVKDKKKQKKDRAIKAMAALRLKDTTSQLSDNLVTSRDSIKAIAPSDIEQLETDMEDNMLVVPFADISYKTCFISGNSNLILKHLDDNVRSAAIANFESSPTEPQLAQESKTKNSQIKLDPIIRQPYSKDLEKRKLSQNLENFSLRLCQKIDTEAQWKGTEKLPQLQTEKNHISETTPDSEFKNFMHSIDDKQNTNNTPRCLLRGWDSCDESQSPPFENDEWLAFLHRSIQELLDGEFDSLKQHNLVSIIVAPLRNCKAIPKVLINIAQLLSLPFVLAELNIVIDVIKSVYIDVKLVPNLMYACKLLVSNRQLHDSDTLLPSVPHSYWQVPRALRTISELSIEEINTACNLYELVCHLVHLQQQFLTQFCDAVAILSVNDLFINFLTHDFKHNAAVRLANCVLALFCCVLRELPENAELVEKIILNPKIKLEVLLVHPNVMVRKRVCQLLRLLARFSLRSVQCIWTHELKCALESLSSQESCSALQLEASQLLEDLRIFYFYDG